MKKVLPVLLSLNAALLGTLLLQEKGVAVRAAATPAGNGDVNGDGLLNIADPVYLCRFLFSDGPGIVPIECPPPTGAGLPATGQTTCYDDAGGEIDCASGDFPGQDGLYQAGCSNKGRFVDHGDGTVTDTCTGLMWQKETAPGGYSWQDALKYCERLGLGGHGDWRLPNVRELQSIVDYGRVDPSIDPIFGTVSENYWTSSTGVGRPHYAWNIFFYNGHVLHIDETYGLFVRAVRGGR